MPRFLGSLMRRHPLERGQLWRSKRRINTIGSFFTFLLIFNIK